VRSVLALLAALTVTTVSHAHFVFVYPTEDKGEVRLVFGHGAAPDPKTPASRCEKTTLTARSAEGQESKLTTEKGDGNFFKAKLATPPSVVFGATETAVSQREGADPTCTTYFPKVVFGDPFAKSAEVGKAVPVELVAVKDGEKLRFKLLADGKPAQGIEVTVGVPGKEGEGEVVKTDKDGLTPAFAEHGRYAVAARVVDDKPGELDGKNSRRCGGLLRWYATWPNRPSEPPYGVGHASPCIHADRVAGGHRHHRDSHRIAFARRTEGPRGRRPNELRQQLEADRAGGSWVSRRPQRPAPAGNLHHRQ
jgi:hypothetical protein